MLAIESATLAAWITGGAMLAAALVGGPIMWLIARLDRRNAAQHDEAAQERRINADLLHRVAEKVDDSHLMLSRHLEWHAHDRPGPVQFDAREVG